MLLKVDPDRKLLTLTDHIVNPAGLNVHGAVLAARPKVNFSIHTHTEA